MNYLDWKKHILIYMVTRAKEIYPAPEDLDFYIYSKIKNVIDSQSLPTALSVVFPVGISVEKAIDCISLAVKSNVNCAYTDEIKGVAVKSISFSVDETIPILTDIKKAINSNSAPTGLINLYQTADFSALARDAPLNLIKFTSISASLDLAAVACVVKCNIAKADLALIYTATIALHESRSLPTLAINIDTIAGVDLSVKPDFTYPIGVGADIDCLVIDEIVATVNDIESKNESVEFDLPENTMTVTASLIEISPVRSSVNAAFSSHITVTCLVRSYIADFIGIYISNLTGRPISSFTIKN